MDPETRTPTAEEEKTQRERFSAKLAFFRHAEPPRPKHCQYWKRRCTKEPCRHVRTHLCLEHYEMHREWAERWSKNE